MRLSLFWRRGTLGALLAIMLICTTLNGLSIPVAQAAGTITGTAFRDFNDNGVKDAAETTGVAGITVTAYDASNTAQGTATTAANGTYSLTATGTGPYRIEFTGLPSYLQPSGVGTNNGTTVQFVPNGTSSNINLGLFNPNDYSQANPPLATTVLRSGSTVASTNLPGLLAFNYNDAGTTAATTSANTSEVGSAWGEAWQRSTKSLFVASFLRRYMGFANGPGYLYLLNYSAGTNNTPLVKVNLQGTAPANGGAAIDLGSVCRRSTTDGTGNLLCDPAGSGLASDYVLPADPTQPSVDLDAFGKVGAISYGDIDLSEDGNTLWLVNLNQRALISVNIGAVNNSSDAAFAASLGTINQYPLAGLPGLPTCTNGVFRPWALSFHDGFGYLGGVCSGETETATTNTPPTNDPTFTVNRRVNTNISAHVLRFVPAAPASGFTDVMQFPLNYTREPASIGNGQIPATWQPWAQTWAQAPSQSPPNNYYSYSQPILSDIEFADDGALILGFTDRFASQSGIGDYTPVSGSTTFYGVVSGGDLVRACAVGAAFVLEGTAASCPVNDPGGTNQRTDDGPSNNGEFFYGDFYHQPGVGLHYETAQGGLAYLAGSGEIISTEFDPITIGTGGTRRFNTTTGNQTVSHELVNGGRGQNGLFYKANGLGDLELLANPAPIEIGNRVWRDVDGDGVQDANESALDGVTVQLWADTNGDGIADTQVGTTTTANGGQYYFGGLGNANLTAGQALKPSTAYEVRIDTTQAVLKGTTLSPANINNVPANPNDPNDLRDSDATLNATTAVIALTTGLAGANNHTYDFGFVPPAPLGAIGNYVWHDEDSDGHQDAGEPGIPNVRVVLKDSQGNVIAETRTDSHGGYLFPKLPAGTYCVDVDETTLPVGMTQTPLTNPGSDFGNQDQGGNGYCVTIAPGEENLTADFGYNNNPTPDVVNPTGSPPAALGDRVWIDTNGNGKQDPNEPGVTGATVTLTTPGPDHIFGTPDDVISGTMTTDANGMYMFDDLAPGAYKVCVTSSTGASHDVLDASQYTQTGDPDHFGANKTTAAPGTAGDNCTTVPVVLGPGDVFLNADFGYQPTPAAPLGSIGDTVWFDADADTHGPSLAPVDGGAAVTQGAPGTADANEYGIPGVTVALIRDTNGDGVYTPGTDPIIATTMTDAKGQYLFPSLPLGNYLVQVNDTASVLTNLTPTYDVDGLGTPNISAAVLTAATPNLRNQDFGYTPIGQTPQLGAIGDTVWFDQDNSGGNQTTQGNEPGIEGVRVDLLNPAGLLIATTVTDENGHYSFGGLPLNATYQVRIDASNFAPGGPLEGMVGTFDPNAPFDNLGPQVTLTTATPINLDQDFSYYASQPGRIGNLVWLDGNANGVYEPAAGETPLGGVTVDLYRDLNGNGVLDPSEPLVATTTTANTVNAGTFGSDGTYIFPGLPAGKYIVDVSDRAGVLAGYWHSRGTDATDNNSQADPYAVTLPAGGENLTADFGYYVKPAAVGNWVWLDANKDGVQNDGETGINDVPVTLTITYPDSTVTTLVTTTGNDPVSGTPGWYSFGNLLQDEDYNGDGNGPEPTFAITTAAPSGLAITQANQGSDDTLDSDPSGVAAQPVKGDTDTLRANDKDPIASYDFGFVRVPTPGAIGNYVWHDEDSDGHQDAGEPGIPNVRVVLKDSQGNVIAETRTDSHGGYLFPNLPPGTYCVDVDETTLPAGMTQTPLTNPGSDFGNQNQGGNGYCVTITPGEENLTADFGYNNNPTSDVDNPPKDAPATLGDRVWIDTNGNGKQDPNEPGVSGATVTLTAPGPDGLFGTPDDVIKGTQTTDSNGMYIFDDLPPGAYKACVTSSTVASHDVLAAGQYTQTGDPDHFGAAASTAAPGTAGDNCTTVPVVLGPGDVFLNADFGYQPTPAAPLGSIGDTIWFDANANTNGPSLAPVDGGAPVTQGAGGTADANEYGIPGVTVALIRDTNGDGVYTPGTDPIIATTTTDAKGQYLFPSLPLGNYLVQVNDTANVLSGLTPTYDLDGLTTPNISAAVLTAATPNLRMLDFGYTPQGQTPQLGAIGDTVWFDRDGSGGNQTTQGSEPGIEGVTVELLNSTGDLLGTTVTDENGHYYFGGLPLNATYQVRIAASNFVPGGPLEGMAGTFDPDGTLDNIGPQVTLTSATPINLDQDFSYATSGPGGRIGNLVWLDSNANGVYESTKSETPLGGVTVDLYRDLNGNGQLDPGEPLVGSTTTVDTVNAGSFGTDGTYLFPNLPASSYIVDVSDRAGVLAGYWHSRGADATDNNSQADPYAVTLAAGGENLTADFGYYVKPAAVGNWVWMDTNSDGMQDDGETGMNGVPVKLAITYPNGTTTLLVTLTSNDPVSGTPGWYSFGNLLQDEDYNGDGKGPEPTFVISTVDTMNGAGATASNMGGNDLLDSDPHAGVAAQPVKGDTDTLRANDADPIASYDFGFVNPTAITLSQFSATWQGGNVKLDWTTTSEIDTFGFHLLRSDDGVREHATRVTTELIPAQGRGQNGASYSWTDTTAKPGVSYTYWLEETETDGSTNIYGPAETKSPSIAMNYHILLPVVVKR